MPRQELTEKELLAWVEQETLHLDLVASWEALCSVYHVLEFTDPLNDSMRLVEFKNIIHEMNRFLTKLKQKLMGCKDVDAMVEVLLAQFNSQPSEKISTREQLAYAKLKQQWITRSIQELQSMANPEEESNEWN